MVLDRLLLHLYVLLVSHEDGILPLLRAQLLQDDLLRLFVQSLAIMLRPQHLRLICKSGRVLQHRGARHVEVGVPLAVEVATRNLRQLLAA